MKKNGWPWRDDHTPFDEWSRFVVVHAALINVGRLWFPIEPNEWPPVWCCLRCNKQMAIGQYDGLMGTRGYLYWCRCGEHGGPMDVYEYRQQKGKK